MKAEMLLPKLTLSLPFTFLLFVQKRNVYRYFSEHIQNFFFFVSFLNSFIFQNSMRERNWWHILLFFIFSVPTTTEEGEESSAGGGSEEESSEVTSMIF